MTVLCKNMTHALKANKLLYQAGIHSRVEKKTSVNGITGCVYTIIFDDEQKDSAFDIMHKGGVILHKKEKVYYGDTEK